MITLNNRSAGIVILKALELLRRLRFRYFGSLELLKAQPEVQRSPFGGLLWPRKSFSLSTTSARAGGFIMAHAAGEPVVFDGPFTR